MSMNVCKSMATKVDIILRVMHSKIASDDERRERRRFVRD
jgi:hypothetical protein